MLMSELDAKLAAGTAKPFPGAPGIYIVRDEGAYRLKDGEVLVVGESGAVNVRLDGRRRSYTVARAMLHAFGPEAPTPQHVAVHLDGDKTNVEVANLAWMTRAEANKRRFTDADRRGENNPASTLTWQIVREARRAHAAGEKTIYALHKQYGVSYRTMWKAINNKTWVE